MRDLVDIYLGGLLIGFCIYRGHWAFGAGLAFTAICLQIRSLQR